ncbi:MAG: gliding motility-associated C-terminal domain-containing protein, partial [Bacteroidetes bacterium]|nr:gliding motility-associated C-terminal domain-containing protein [Bacteroidota bacterium]
GCQSLTPDIVTVNVTPPIQVFMYPGDTIVYEGDQIQLHAVSAGTYYNWTPATGLSDPTIADPVVTAGVTGSYITYHVITTTSAGCSGDGFVTIKVYKGPDIYLPNAFTPNGDGLNETFKPFTVGIKTINYFKIFNRWGQMIYSSTGMDTHGWDGKYLGVAQGSGAYVWVIEAITSDNRKIFKKGTVTLVR